MRIKPEMAEVYDTSYNPCVSLLLAILERALRDAVGPEGREQRDATAWLFSKAKREWSAEWIATQIENGDRVLKLCRDGVRGKVPVSFPTRRRGR